MGTALSWVAGTVVLAVMLLTHGWRLTAVANAVVAGTLVLVFTLLSGWVAGVVFFVLLLAGSRLLGPRLRERLSP